MITLVILVLLTLSISFLCSLCESVLLSVSPVYIAVQKKRGTRTGKILAELKTRINEPLAAILTLNTVANMMGASAIGAQILKIYGEAQLAVASALLTVAVLFASEIVPKTLGALHWKRLAPICGHFIRFLVFILYPVVWLGKQVSSTLSHKKVTGITREEVLETAELGATEGAIRERERRVIRNLLMLDSIEVQEIMTPRSVVLAVSRNETVASVVGKHKPIRFSRIPVFENDLDHILGVVQRYKIMDASSHDLDDLRVTELMGPVHTVPDDISVAAALDQFIKRQEHLFMVIDQFGKTEGIVTLEDAIETLLGVEIVDELDHTEDMRKYALDLWAQKKKTLRA